ncbi:MAG: hypothetical protein JO033_07445 [Acidobacteriaceae bacterium]|nr:hypothetical protein [Acidobacteriaceae bacterium]MBV9499520.1 hypothetical protein [Acidobacteriaceae bacterium]
MIRRFVFALMAMAGSLSGATSTAWEVAGVGEFLKGRLSGLSLSADGILQPGPSIRWDAALNQPAGWSIAAGPDGAVYAGSGHQGKIFRITSEGKSSVIWTAPQSEIFAIAFDRSGALWAGSSPSGSVYRMEAGAMKEVWHAPTHYIWALEPCASGGMYVATGEPGRIYEVQPSGQVTLFYDTGQTNVTALAVGPNGHLYAGTDPNGILYEISGRDQGTILYDSTLPEIRAIAVDPNGVVYAAAMGGAVTSRTAVPASATTMNTAPVVAGAPTVITVTAAKENGVPSDDEQAQVKPSSDQSRTAGSSASASAATSNTAVVEVSGVEKSAIYRITPERVIETLRSSTTDNVYDLTLDGDNVLFSTDDHARIYRLTGRRATLISEPGSGETTRLLKTGALLIAALSNPARVMALSPAGDGAAGFYESQIHDATSVAHWGHLQWRGTGSGVLFRTRSGNAARPDSTWSNWSSPLTDPANALISSPPARFVQWRAEWPAGSKAMLDDVTISFLPQNNPPSVHSITVSSIVSSNPVKTSAPSSSSASTGAYSVTVTDTGTQPAASTATATTQNVSRLQTTQTQISWQADDPDGDKLVYSVYFRAEDQTQWQLIRNHMFENTLLLDADVFADGRYFFRVVASDAPSNAAQYVQTAELVSSPVLIDNTPPVVTLGAPHWTGESLDIDLEAVDQSSSLRLCEYSLDAGLWQPIEAVDGITDSPREQFHLHLAHLHPGEHLLVFRVYDSANNAGLAKVVLR